MSLLSPWALVTALAIGLPTLLILYMLRLRRSPRQVSSTLLWRKSVEDLLANTPFQRLRWSILLLLQALALALIALALGRPVDSGSTALRGRVIVLIDCSASMAARWAPGSGGDAKGSTRLDEARRAVEAMIARLGRDDAASEMMLVAFAREPEVLSGFERSRDRLRDALATVVATDEEADLEAALALVDGFAQQSGDELDEVLPPTLVVVTDGNVRPPRRSEVFRSEAAEVLFVQVGPRGEPQPAAGGDASGMSAAGAPAPSPGRPGATATAADASDATGARRRAEAAGHDNVGIVAISAERGYEDPSTVSLFARLTNSGATAVDTTVVIRADDRVVGRRTLSIPARGARPGEATLLEEVELPVGALLVVEQTRPDALASDDVAAVVLPAPRAPRVTIVAPESRIDPFLQEVLDGAGVDSIAVLDPDAWAARGPDGRVRAPSGAETSEPAPDLVIFDRVAPREIPNVSSLTIGAAPPGFAIGEAPQGGRRILGWSRQHPLLRHVDLDDLVYSGSGALAIPEAAEALAQSADGPVIAAFSERGNRHAVIAFPLRRSNLPILPGFPVLILNALDHLAAGGAGQWGRTARPGESIVVRTLPAVESLVIVDGAERRRVIVRDPLERRAPLPTFATAGVRRIEGAEPPDDLVAVSVLSEIESDLAPREAPAITTASRSRGSAEQRRELWPWAALAALIVLGIEWIVYLRRAGRA
ncbi:MAG TPA: VWA domain-containing protein [Phycisphaerales bacterium]|nr:VWA domain-containing protein [Phycisphaerales bacterium]HMP38056.1 VWA domain-containing protein [Phycisphaerales bacterium]